MQVDPLMFQYFPIIALGTSHDLIHANNVERIWKTRKRINGKRTYYVEKMLAGEWEIIDTITI